MISNRVQDVFSIKIKINDLHLIMETKELGNQNRAEVSGAAGHKNIPQASSWVADVSEVSKVAKVALFAPHL